MKRSLLGIVTLSCCVLSLASCRKDDLLNEEEEGDGTQVVPAANSV
jgi:hypothetical protein